jgi:hypothetical protein
MRRVVFALAVAAMTFIGGSRDATAQQSAQAGTLNCDISGGLGFIVASKKDVNCIFQPAVPGAPPESYAGSISKFGLDIGGTTNAQMAWAVFATGGWVPGALAGDYAGATAEATFAVGLGANVLLGGNNRSIALQPLSLTGQTGLNAAGGVAVLRLTQTR